MGTISNFKTNILIWRDFYRNLQTDKIEHSLWHIGFSRWDI